MAISTYDQLKSAIAAWTHRSDLTSYLGDFIAHAENRIFSDLRVKEMEDRTTYTPTTRYLATPARMTGIRRITAQTNPPVQLMSVSPDGLQQRYDETSGTPLYFSILGDEIQFNKIPSCDVEIQYYAAPAALSASATTNAILTAYPQIYLAASMIEAMLFMVNDAGVAKWVGLYNEALARANKKSTTFHTSGPMAVIAA